MTDPPPTLSITPMPDDFGPDEADPLFQANPSTVRSLLSDVQAKELAVPDFQRNFVWDVENTRELLASVMSRYPAGTLLFLKIGQVDQVFRPRQVEGAPDLEGAIPRELVLDGQQRLTALYQALYGRGDHRFFIDFKALRSDDGSILAPEELSFDEVILVEPRKDDGTTQYDARETQIENWLYPVDQYYRQNNLDDWLDEVVANHATGEAAQTALKSELRTIRDRYLTRLALYAFPVVRLEEGTSLAAICKIFETLNRQGEPLTVFELLTARFWPQDVNLRDLWQSARDQSDIIEEFALEPYALLQAISLRARSSAQRSEVLKLDAEAIKDYWDDVVRGFAGALELVKNDCGVLTSKWLPYAMVLVPMAAVWHSVEGLRGPKRGKARDKLKQYFWCSVFTGNFDQGANSQAGTDYKDLKEWLTDDTATPPEAVGRFFFSEDQLLGATVKRRALYSGVMALTVTSGAKDFHTSQKLTSDQVRSQKIDAHHIFPKKWLAENYRAADEGPEGTAHSPELILNRALIDKETNQRIRARAPSEYLADIREVRGDSALNEILDSHLLPNQVGAGLFEDEYDQFLMTRLGLVVDQIEAVTGKQVSRDLAGAEGVLAPATP